MSYTPIVIGLGYGDEGKGSWVDHLVRRDQIQVTVRFNGGAQAGHHVKSPDGQEHIFAQFGAGMFNPYNETLLSRFMLIEPEALFNESRILEAKGVADTLGRLTVSENAPVVTPMNRILNRMHERMRGGSRHGSCGFGIGITQGDVETLGRDALYVRDLKADGGRSKLLQLYERKREEAAKLSGPETRDLAEQFSGLNFDHYADLFLRFYHQTRVVSEEEIQEIIREKSCVFEGAQGVLLDQCYGHFPHCTRSNCTFKNAELLLKEAGVTEGIERIGLLRGYSTRHGAGPFVTEDPALSNPALQSAVVPARGVGGCHNHYNDWQGDFRLGWFDAVSARYALAVTGGVDTLAITNLDRMDELSSVKIGVAYESKEGSPFFTENMIRVPEADTDYDFLARRTAALATVTPRYRECQGWSRADDKALQVYLDTLSGEVGTPVKAWSASLSHQKVYRQ